MILATSLVLALTLQNPGSAAEANGKTPPAAPTAPKPVGPDEDRPFVRLFPNLIQDIKKLPSTQTLLLAMAGTAGSAIAGSQDQPAMLWSFRAGGQTELSRVGEKAGEGWVQASVALGTYAFGRFSGKPGVTHLGSDFIRAQFLNGLVTTSLKYAVDRTRPNGGSYSFPSGHTSASFTTAAVLQGHYGWKAGAPAFALASFIGWTRIRDHAHWSSDVISGATIGTIVGFTVTKGHLPGNWIVAPTPIAGGFAITVARVPLER
jgi:hypothetical protein